MIFYSVPYIVKWCTLFYRTLHEWVEPINKLSPIFLIVKNVLLNNLFLLSKKKKKMVLPIICQLKYSQIIYAIVSYDLPNI